MTPENQERLNACIQEAAAILYADSDPSTLATLEEIEAQVRRQLLEQVGPQVASFLSEHRPTPAKENGDA